MEMGHNGCRSRLWFTEKVIAILLLKHLPKEKFKEGL